jgi:hypothetical protein
LESTLIDGLFVFAVAIDRQDTQQELQPVTTARRERF